MKIYESIFYTVRPDDLNLTVVKSLVFYSSLFVTLNAIRANQKAEYINKYVRN